MVPVELMIAAYQPIDEREALHRDALLELLRTSPEPFSRTQFVPCHVTASCFIIDLSTGRLLLHQHRRLNRWLQMGGHVEPGENPVDAALREGTEESGLTELDLLVDGIIDLDVHLIPPGRGEPQHRHFDVRYAARTAQHIRESHELMWFDFDRAAEVMAGEESLRVIRKIRSVV